MPDEIDSIIASARLSFNSSEFLGVLKAMYAKYHQAFNNACGDESIAQDRISNTPLCGNDLISNMLDLVSAVASASARKEMALDMMEVLEDIIKEAEPGWLPDAC